MLAHFKDYNDIIGDLPQNLLTTSLALNGYMLSGEEKYKAWLLEYVDAWVERMKQNGDIIPVEHRLGRQDRRGHGRQMVRRLLRLGLHGRRAAGRQPGSSQYASLGFHRLYECVSDDR